MYLEGKWNEGELRVRAKKDRWGQTNALQGGVEEVRMGEGREEMGEGREER